MAKRILLADIQVKMNQKAPPPATLKKAVELSPANKRRLPKKASFKNLLDDPEFKKIFGN
jgi:hypothetical protein